jgi:hypothetical protein
MSETVVQTVYFEKPGEENTDRTLELAKARAEELGIRNVIVATTRGVTGRKAAQVFRGFRVVVVTHVAGFREANDQELTAENRAAIEAAGASILTATHVFGGIGRAVRKRLGTYELEEIVAYTLRNFCQGVKVVCELALMAADAGLVRTDEEAMAIAGTGWGADTAAVLLPANTSDFFNLRVLELVCKPRMAAIRK